MALLLLLVCSFDKFMFGDPLKNIKAFGIRETDILADLGAGTGFYSIHAAQIADKGKIYAVEISKDFLDTIKSKIKDAHLKNIETIWGDVEKLGGTKIGKEIVDKVIASNIFHQVEDKKVLVEEIKRILKNGGEVLVIDWDKSPLVHAKFVLPKEKIRDIFEQNGFIFEREIGAGSHHYGMILRKS
jgi:ubiquinone/menaquinone biosynthesis C-methylase UbiE